MNTLTRIAVIVSTAAAGFVSTGCADMTPRQKSTAVGAAVGGVAGSVLTGGSTMGTVGGAAVGGVIGNEVGKKK